MIRSYFFDSFSILLNSRAGWLRARNVCLRKQADSQKGGTEGESEGGSEGGREDGSDSGSGHGGGEGSEGVGTRMEAKVKREVEAKV